MERFSIGQEVVCTNGSGWSYTKIFFSILGFDIAKGRTAEGPGKDEIVTVVGYAPSGNLYLAEYHPVVNGCRGAYPEKAFQPIVPMETIDELMESLQNELTI